MNRSIDEECLTQIKERMIPFWVSLRDKTFGGYIGEHSGISMLPHAPKGSIYHARILWFFSTCAKVLPLETEQKNLVLDAAEQAYRFIRNVLWDTQKTGVYWSVDWTGKALDTDKHIYALAFTLYGLSAYYSATKSPEVLAFAQEVFNCMETKCRNKQGYLEQFDIDWKAIPNTKLSDGSGAPKTMNSMLHVMEAYTEFFNATGEGKSALEYTYSLLMDKVLNDKLGRMDLFFDEDYQVKNGNEKSYGHDIEASWLLTEAAKATGHFDDDKARILRLADCTIAEGFDGNALVNEIKEGITDTDRIWWVQAEAIVGLVNAFQITGDSGYLSKARAIWDYTKTHLIGDKEWFNAVTIEGKAYDRPIAGMWKCPYHNGRMFMELLKRHISF
ncbi:cellobiose 2-epimerase [Spirochaetia bacterium]|nr:cellobiose 2-epimerase [Spirochaetia bacterium]